MLLEITLFLAAAILLVPLGKGFGLPTVLGYLFTGIIVGPSILNIANNPDNIMKLAEYGVIMLMFLIGLEIRPQRLWQMRQSIFILGGLQIAVTTVVLLVLLWIFLPISWVASLVIGCALALSSTAFILQVLENRQELKTFYGQQAFAVLLFQDIAAMVLLALIPILAGHHSPHHGVGYFAAIIATFSGLFLFSRYILRPLFRFVVKSGASELLTAVGLFIVLAVVCLMDALELSTTLGAFLTGLLLADSEFRHEIEASIQPFKGLLLGLFFMAIGMGIQLNVVLDHPWFIVGGAIALLVVKAICLTLVACLRKHSFSNGLKLGVALAQGGEFAFVVFTLATTEKIIPQDLLAPLTLLVTLSMILTPVLFWILDHWIEPKLNPHKDTKPQFDDISPKQQHLLIAGFGRFGQIVARIAHLHHIAFTAIDNNLDNIDFVRQYGGQVYYGDATQSALLHSAGLKDASIFILAIDDIEDSMQVARYIRLYHPEITIFARARDRHHVYLLKEIGVKHIWRETYYSALGVAEKMLIQLGLSPEQAQHGIKEFSKYDEQLLERQQGVYADSQKFIETHREMLSELENLFENDQFVQQSNLDSKQAPSTTVDHTESEQHTSQKP